MKIILIAAMNRDRIIGLKNTLPWRLPADLKRFRELTRGHCVIMGRKTWDSLGRALPERLNIVITRNSDFLATGAVRANSLEAALTLAKGPHSPNREKCYVIGGAEIYRLALPSADTLQLTWVEYAGAGDAYFPEWDSSRFQEVAKEEHPAAYDTPAHSFVTYERA
jgi:dihydrofolate reductase